MKKRFIIEFGWMRNIANLVSFMVAALGILTYVVYPPTPHGVVVLIILLLLGSFVTVSYQRL